MTYTVSSGTLNSYYIIPVVDIPTHMVDSHEAASWAARGTSLNLQLYSVNSINENDLEIHMDCL